MPSYHTFEELDCYKRCRSVRLWVHSFIKEQQIKDRDIFQNITRAARSTTRNIAEGFGRHYHKENIQYCRITIGSLHEIIEDLHIVEDENLAAANKCLEGRKLIFSALKSTQGYIKYLQSRSSG